MVPAMHASFRVFFCTLAVLELISHFKDLVESYITILMRQSKRVCKSVARIETEQYSNFHIFVLIHSHTFSKYSTSIGLTLLKVGKAPFDFSIANLGVSFCSILPLPLFSFP